jgi:hypothetical protein
MFFQRDVRLAQEYLAFLLLNMFDLFLTGYIFKNGGMEANGVAVWVMSLSLKYGLMFFAIYKFLLVIIVVLACEGIATRSILKSKIIITAGCLVYLFLVIYESQLIYHNITGVSHQASPAMQLNGAGT